MTQADALHRYPGAGWEADKAFMRAWNFLVSHGLRYTASYREMARDGKDELVRYRAMEMGRLLDWGRIREFDYGLCNKVLDHFEVTLVGKLAVIFLTGTRVTVRKCIQYLYNPVSNTPYLHLGLFRILYKHEALVGYTYLRCVGR